MTDPRDEIMARAMERARATNERDHGPLKPGEQLMMRPLAHAARLALEAAGYAVELRADKENLIARLDLIEEILIENEAFISDGLYETLMAAVNGRAIIAAAEEQSK